MPTQPDHSPTAGNIGATENYLVALTAEEHRLIVRRRADAYPGYVSQLRQSLTEVWSAEAGFQPASRR